MLDSIRSGNRRSLSKAITLVESDAPQDKLQAKKLLQNIGPNHNTCLKIGVSGPPGAGKSSLIESFGLFLLDQIDQLAVLTIDPSSQITQGSILGDKTRMQKLSQHPRAYIRPSPAKNHLGGTTEHTEETLLLCEAAGFDIVLIETVGVGQSESEIANLVDLLVLLVSPAAGDELQGIKRGLFELANLIVVSKHDGNLKTLAKTTQKAYQSALHLMGRSTPVLCVSALESTGLQELWATIQSTQKSHLDIALLEQRFWNLAQKRLLNDFKNTPSVQSQLPIWLEKVQNRQTTLWQAVQNFFLACFLIFAGCSHKPSISDLIHELQGTDQKLAYRALIKLTQIGDPRALEAVITYSDRKSPDIKIQAILAARQFKSPRALAWLFVLSTGHPDENVRNAAREAFACLERENRA